MQYFRNSDMLKAFVMVMGCTAVTTYAANEPLAPQDNSIDEINKIIEQNQRPERRSEPLSTTLPSDSAGPTMSKEESIAYLRENPEEFEALLGQLLKQANAASLEELLPYYQQVPNYDPSIIDWGTANITAL